jgi:hypothetical protein
VFTPSKRVLRGGMKITGMPLCRNIVVKPRPDHAPELDERVHLQFECLPEDIALLPVWAQITDHITGTRSETTV